MSSWREALSRLSAPPPPFKVRVNLMVIEEVVSRLHPGREGELEAQNDAAMALSDSTYQLVDDLSRAVEADVKSALSR